MGLYDNLAAGVKAVGKVVAPNLTNTIDSAYNSIYNNRVTSARTAPKVATPKTATTPTAPTTPTYAASNPPSLRKITPAGTGAYTGNIDAAGKAIQQAQATWQAASQRGDTDAMNKAHALAEAIRNEAGIASIDGTKPTTEEAMSAMDQLKKAQEDLAKERVSAFDKLFGTESRISQFYAPAVKAVEEQLLDVEELLSTLKQDVVNANQEVGLTQSQFNLIEGKKREGLTDQLDKLTRAESRLKAGLDTQMKLSEKEYDILSKNAEDKYQTTYDSIQEIKDKEEKLKTGAETALSDIQDFVLSAGVIPSESFQNVINHAMEQVKAGANLGQIKFDMLKAVGMHPQVKKYVEMTFQKAEKALKGSGGSKTKATNKYESDSYFNSLINDAFKTIDEEGGDPSQYDFPDIEDYISKTVSQDDRASAYNYFKEQLDAKLSERTPKEPEKGWFESITDWITGD